MTWNLNNSLLPDSTVIRRKDLELFEIGSKKIKSPLFKANPLARYGSTNPSDPTNGNNSEGYIPVVDNTTALTPTASIKAYLISDFWQIASLDKISRLNDIVEDSYFNYTEIEQDYTYIFSNLSSFTGELELQVLVPRELNNYIFSFDLTSYNLDTISKVVVEGLPFLSSGTLPQQFTYIDGVLNLYAKASCRPFANQTALVSSSSTISNFLVTLDGLVFDLNSLELDYVDALTYQNKTYYFSLFPESGGLTYNRTTKLAYIWL